MPRPSFIDPATSSSAPSSSSKVRLYFIKLKNVEHGQLILPATHDEAQLLNILSRDMMLPIVEFNITDMLWPPACRFAWCGQDHHQPRQVQRGGCLPHLPSHP